MPFATEVAVFYYGFVNWQVKPLRENEFTYHKNSGTIALMAAFMLIIGIETIAFHFLIARWNTAAAWVLTLLSIYTAIQVLGFAKSLSKRPVSINENGLTLKYGILNAVEIPFSDIVKIELSGRSLDKDECTKTLSPFGEIESHNVIIQVKKQHELIGLYGFKKKFKVIALYLDEPTYFKEQLDNALNKLTPS